MLLYLHDIITGISDDDFIALQNDHPEEDPSRARANIAQTFLELNDILRNESKQQLDEMDFP